MRPCGASAASTWASVAPAPARTQHASASTATARSRLKSTTTAGTRTAAAPMRPLPPPRATSGTPAPAAQRTRAATSAVLAGSATASGRVASAANSGRPRDGRMASRPPAASSAPSVWSTSAGQASRNPSSTPIAATLPPPSRSGDGGGSRPRRSRRWLTRIAREAGSPRAQARAAPLRAPRLRHGKAELVGHDVAGRLADAARHGLLRPLRPPTRRLLHVPPERPDDIRLPLRLGERLDRQLHALTERAGAPAAAAAGGRLQVNLPANLAARIRDRVDVDVRPAIEQRLHEIVGHGQRGRATTELVLVERDPDRARDAGRGLVDVGEDWGTGQARHGDDVRDTLIRLVVLEGGGPAGAGQRPAGSRHLLRRIERRFQRHLGLFGRLSCGPERERERQHDGRGETSHHGTSRRTCFADPLISLMASEEAECYRPGRSRLCRSVTRSNRWCHAGSATRSRYAFHDALRDGGGRSERHRAREPRAAPSSRRLLHGVVRTATAPHAGPTCRPTAPRLQLTREG